VIPLPTRRLALVTALAVPVVIVLPVAAVAIVPALLVVWLIDFVMAPHPRRIDVERTFPSSVVIGRRADVSWQVGNPTRRRVRIDIDDQMPPSFAAPVRGFSAVVTARGTATASTTIEPRRRGRFTLAEIAVRTRGPFGLGARQQRRRRPLQVMVFPPLLHRDEAELRINQARVLQIGLRAVRARGTGTEFEALREYTPDDEFRRIDWAATARTGTAVVKEYRTERNQSLLVLVDTGRTMAGQVAPAVGEPPVARLEHAIDAALVLTYVASRLGDRAGLVTFDTAVRRVVAPSSGAVQLQRATEALFDLDVRLVETDYAAAFGTTLARFGRRSLLIVLTELTEAAVTLGLAPALPILTRRHLVIVGSVADPAVAAMAAEAGGGTAATYRAAAAAAALAERRRVAGQLRSLGATVVDADPSMFAAALTDAYLEIKPRL
jgi:uncharacterized protein (DUF58 family)